MGVYAGKAPDIFNVIGSSLGDAYPLMQTRIRVFYTLCAIAAVIGLIQGLGGQKGSGIEGASGLLSAVASFYALQSVIRSRYPDFSWSFEKVVMVILIGLACGLTTAIGFVLCVVPGVWIGTKWSMTYLCFLMPSGRNPFGESWDLTTGQFWETFGLLVLTSLIAAIVGGVAGGIAAGISFFAPILAVVLEPASLYVSIVMVHFTTLTYVRWLWILRERHQSAGGYIEAAASLS